MGTEQATVDARFAEMRKYRRAYEESENYRMSKKRMDEANWVLDRWEAPGTLLDLGCGRGEMLRQAEARGFDSWGLECVPELCGARVTQGWVHAVPFASGYFDFATSWDVIEHLVPGDDWKMLCEMRRVSRRGAAISANNKPSFHKDDDLHINRRPYEEWDEMIRSLWDNVTFYPKRYSPIWVMSC